MIDTGNYNREEAKTQCESFNMSLVTFEIAGKYETIKDWLTEKSSKNNVRYFAQLDNLHSLF